jgi:hypothetical protein
MQYRGVSIRGTLLHARNAHKKTLEAWWPLPHKTTRLCKSEPGETCRVLAFAGLNKTAERKGAKSATAQ